MRNWDCRLSRVCSILSVRGLVELRGGLIWGILVSCLVLLFSGICSAGTISVALDGSGDYLTIQAGIDGAFDGDEVIVADGVWRGDGNRDIDFKGKAITVRSENGPEFCIIDCDGDSNSPHRAFYFHHNEGSGSIVEGLTLEKGYMMGPSAGISSGGAIFCEETSPTIRDCVIRNCQAIRGGGIACFDSDAIVERCILNGNEARTGGGGIVYYGQRPGQCPKIVNSLIYGNITFESGGGIKLGMHGELLIINCTIIGNAEKDGVGSNHNGGGGISVLDGNVTISNSILWGNTAEALSGGDQIYLNQTGFSHSWPEWNWSHIELENCCLDNRNGNDVVILERSSYNANQVLFDSPLFVDFDEDDFRLSAGSPCVDAGTNEPPGGLSDMDIVWLPRIWDGDQDGVAIVDIGAFETISSGDLGLVTGKSEYSFNALKDGDNPDSTMLLIWNLGISELVWKIEGACDWLVISEDTGVTAGNGGYSKVLLGVDVADLAEGDYVCELSIQSAEAFNSPQMVTVNLHVTGPIIEVSETHLDFTGFQNGANPSGQSFLISNSGGGTLNWAIEESLLCNCLTIEPSSGILVAGESTSVTVDVGLAGLGWGEYKFALNIWDMDGDSVFQEVIVNLDVIGPRAEGFGPNITFWVPQAGNDLEPEKLEVRNGGGGQLVWSVEKDLVCGWVMVEPEAGVLGASETDEITFYADSTGLSDGIHECNLKLSAENAEGPSLSVKVSMLVGFEVGLCVPYEYKTIQEAIDASVDGDVVIVADGVWRGDGNRDIEFGGKAITVRSANGAENCIIDSEGSYSLTYQAEDMHYGFRFLDEDVDSVLDGFTITGGDAYFGGGIRCGPESNPLIRNCIIKGNIGYNGGGVFRGGAGMELRDCVISDNISFGDGYGDGGGGIYGCNGLINNCVIENNFSNLNGGGLHECGGRITGCVIRNNKGLLGGGLSNCHGKIENCLIVENLAYVRDVYGLRPEGGGLYNCDGEISNCTISNNFCQTRLGMAVRDCGGSITNCIIWGNRAKDFAGYVEPTFSCYPGESEGLGNVHVDPGFVEGSYYLRPDSVCIDAGDSSIVVSEGVDVYGNGRLVDGDGDGTARVDIGAYEFDSGRQGIFLSLVEMVFGGGVGLENPASQVFSIGCYGGGSVAWQVDTGGCEWIEVSEVGGDLAAGETTKVKVGADLSGLEAGEYRCELVILADGAEGSGSKISVLLRVGEIVNVPGDWGTIQEAIDNCENWSVVIVAPGVYKENINYNGKAVTVRSSSPTNWEVIESTVIDGDNKGICVVFENGEGHDSVLDGFTVTNGAGDREFKVGYDLMYSPIGGGIYCKDSSPVIRRCNVRGNGGAASGGYVQAGGGITVSGKSEAIIDTCMVTDNITKYYAPGIFLPGWAYESACKVLNCTVANNFTTNEINLDNVSSYSIDGFASLATISNTIVSSYSDQGIRAGDPGLVSNCYLKTLNFIFLAFPGGGVPIEINSGHGIVSDDPGFINDVGLLARTGERGDYRLRGDSICINRGGEDYDGSVAFDIEGEPRVLRGRVDIGADEVGYFGDIQFDDEVGMGDFAYIAGRWMESDCGISNNFCGRADVDGNGVVGFEDVVVLSEAWITGVLTDRESNPPYVHLRFNELSGNHANDGSENDWDGTLLNMNDGAWVAGKVGNALSFDGVDDRVEIHGYQGIGGGTSRTVCAWIKTVDTSGEIVSWGVAGPGGRWNFVTEGSGFLRVEVGGGAIVGSTFVCDNEWHYVCAVLEDDGSPNINEVRLYVDGVEDVPSSAGDKAINTVFGADLTIGAWVAGGRYFEGLIDEVRIYDRALTPEEISQLAATN